MFSNSSNHRILAQAINIHRALTTFGPISTTNQNNNNNNDNKAIKSSSSSSPKIDHLMREQKNVNLPLIRNIKMSNLLANIDSSTTTIMRRQLCDSSQRPNVENITIRFHNGHFKFQFYDRYQTILGFWQTCSDICSIVEKDFMPSAGGADMKGSDMKSNKIISFRIVSLEDKGSEFQLAQSMPIGFLFAAIEPKKILVQGLDKDQKIKAEFGFEIDQQCLENIKLWSETHFKENLIQSQRHAKPKSSFIQHEISFLEQERQQLQNEIAPLRAEFEKIVQIARTEAHRKFKIGGLFLLSSQLGFVGRLTYFEYSWDIMEPVTWILTYSLVVGSYAYYMITSEEYLIPSVERRLVVDRFWKLTKTHKFDADAYRQLRERIVKLDKQIHKLNAKLTIAH